MEIARSVLKVVEPYEGSAFMAAPDMVASCWHVCVAEGADPEAAHPVVFWYYPTGEQAPVALRGDLLPDQSDEEHDLAVVRVRLPAGVAIPPARMSPDDEAGYPVIAMGFPDQQSELEEVDGVIFPHHPVKRMRFEGDVTAREVLRIDTRAVGFYRDRDVPSGMSGGPLVNKATQTVVAVVMGKKPRGLQPHSPPDGYAISLRHLVNCSPKLSPYVRPATVHGSMVEVLVETANQPGMRGPVVDWVIRQMATPDSHHRHWCYIVLGSIGGEAAEIVVSRGLFDEDELARMGAARAWELLGH
ncbi:MAG: serine protease [Acidobacteriota bacterium]